MISATINILTTLIAIATIDRIGRKPLLIIGSVGMTITLATMAIIFGTASACTAVTEHCSDKNVADKVPDLTTAVLGSASATIALIAANLFVVAFGMSWGPVVWVLLGEMFPNRMRAAALSLAAGGQWVANWIITVSFPTLKDISLALAYGLYAGFALLSFFFVLKIHRGDEGQATGGHARLIARTAGHHLPAGPGNPGAPTCAPGVSVSSGPPRPGGSRIGHGSQPRKNLPGMPRRAQPEHTR